LYEPGPVRVSLRIRERAVVALRTYVGGAWRPGDRVTDLGTVPAAAAASYLLAMARRDDGRPAQDAIFAAALADSAVIWRDLLAIARNREIRNDTRKKAVFWLGQEAEAAATAGLDALIDAGDETREVREAAVFALSQRPRDEGVPALIRIARDHRDARLRQRALFWLAQSNDPRAVDLFEEILTRK
jgi:HEAT repeat protein